jgi:hypothetical protein
MTVFEMARELKSANIVRLKEEMDDAWETAHEPGASTETARQFFETYNSIRSCREQMKQDLIDIDYSTEEIDFATQRLDKIKKIDARGRNESEDSIPLMKGLWLQLVKALLLQKDDKSHPMSPTTFEGTPSADKGHIAGLAREECAKLNRLKLNTSERIRAFAERCKFEFRFCSWLRMYMSHSRREIGLLFNCNQK